MRDTWDVPGYDLAPRLRRLNIPTLVIAADHDFFPLEMAERLSRGIPDAQIVTLTDCGHFAYLECPSEVAKALRDFFRRPRAPSRD